MAAAGADSGALRAAAPPFLTLLGVALPLAFAALIDQYLHYLRPAQLLPAYATAWLLTAALTAPLFVALTVVLWGLGRSDRLASVREVLARALLALAAAVVIATLIKATKLWFYTFSAGEHPVPELTAGTQWLALALGLLVVLTSAGRRAVGRVSRLALWSTLAGGASLALLPLNGWPDAAPELARSQAAGADPAQRPNIVLLSIDALSAQHMSLYGAARPTTPRLDAFAAGATSYTRAYASGNYTTPAVSSLLTGTRPWTHRAFQLLAWPLPETRVRSLPAVLAHAGYQLGYVSTNAHAGAAALGFGADFQFAAHDATHDTTLCSDALMAHFKYACAAAELPLLSLFDRLAAAAHDREHDNAYADPSLATGRALEWLAHVDHRRPVFVWVHLLPPHSPYAAPAPWLGRFDPSPDARTIAETEPAWAYLLSAEPPARVRTLAARYDESVSYVDQAAGEFLARALALLGDDTAVIVTADHGESFGHGYGAHTGPGLYEEIIHVPLIIRWPHQRQAAHEARLTEQVDLAPTLAVLAGESAPASWEGHSLLSAAVAPARVFSMNFEENRRYAPLTTGSVALIEGDWKLVHYLGALHYPLMPALHDELYDLAADAGELNDRAATEPERTQSLRAELEQELRRHAARVP